MLRTIQGTPVPALGFGTWELVGDDTYPGVTTALDVGYRHIDTAQVYENEAEVGRALADSDVGRDEVFLTTKVWTSEMTPEGIRSSTEESLARLRTDHVDLLLLHWPVHLDRLEANLEALVAVAEAGAARHVGVSNFTPAQLERALELAPIFCNQVEHHVYLAQPRLLELGHAHDLLFTAYSPLARGLVLDDPDVVAIAEARGATPAQVAMRWILDEGDHTAVIPKATSRAHIEENLAVLDVELSDDDRRRLAALDRDHRTVDPPWAPDWSR